MHNADEELRKFERRVALPAVRGRPADAEAKVQPALGDPKRATKAKDIDFEAVLARLVAAPECRRTLVSLRVVADAKVERSDIEIEETAFVEAGDGRSVRRALLQGDGGVGS